MGVLNSFLSLCVLVHHEVFPINAGIGVDQGRSAGPIKGTEKV